MKTSRTRNLKPKDKNGQTRSKSTLNQTQEKKLKKNKNPS